MTEDEQGNHATEPRWLARDANASTSHSWPRNNRCRAEGRDTLSASPQWWRLLAPFHASRAELGNVACIGPAMTAASHAGREK